MGGERGSVPKARLSQRWRERGTPGESAEWRKMSEGEGAVRPNQERRARAAGSRLYVALGVVVAILFVAGVGTLLPRPAQKHALAQGNQTQIHPPVARGYPPGPPPPGN